VNKPKNDINNIVAETVNHVLSSCSPLFEVWILPLETKELSQNLHNVQNRSVHAEVARVLPLGVINLQNG